jgi:hypothetical protein
MVGTPTSSLSMQLQQPILNKFRKPEQRGNPPLTAEKAEALRPPIKEPMKDVKFDLRASVEMVPKSNLY